VAVGAGPREEEIAVGLAAAGLPVESRVIGGAPAMLLD